MGCDQESTLAWPHCHIFQSFQRSFIFIWFFFARTVTCFKTYSIWIAIGSHLRFGAVITVFTVHEQVDQVSITIIGMLESSGFKNIPLVGCFSYSILVFVFVVVFFVVFVFVFVFLFHFWIAIFINLKNMYGKRGLSSLWAVLLIIFKVITNIPGQSHTYSNSTYRLGPSGRMGQVKTKFKTHQAQNASHEDNPATGYSRIPDTLYVHYI